MVGMKTFFLINQKYNILCKINKGKSLNKQDAEQKKWWGLSRISKLTSANYKKYLIISQYRQFHNSQFDSIQTKKYTNKYMYAPSYNHGKHASYSSIKKIKNYSYNPLDSIGKGFSSVVYRGQNDQNSKIQFMHGELVAIKAIDMRGIRDSAARQMLDFQIQALTTLSHPNIMKCFDVVKETSHCYVITELCNGGDLGEMLKKKGRFTEVETHKILKDIVKAYIEIGHKGFLHRDLKLANVLMNNGHAKIADFGFAKKCKSQSIKQRYNVGSPLYMSPEALKNNIYSMKNDIWSIGIMAFQMLHGDTPWPCKTQKQLIEKMVKVPVKFRDSLKISSDMKDFIRKCLQVSQNKRMSLEGLVEWIEQQQQSDQKQNRQNIPYQPPRLAQKITAIQKLQSRPLSELTNKMSLGPQNSKSVNKIKAVNTSQNNSKDKLSKSVISHNNNLVIKEIILFRLYFKALQKLKSSNQLTSPTQLKNILGNETIRRVALLKKLICSEEISANQHYSLKNVETYLNPIFNPEIKKYKSVVSEYFNKYTAEIKMEVLEGKLTPSQIITTFLKSLTPTLIEKESLLLHWLVNLTRVGNHFSKNQLESILQPKDQITPSYVKERIQEVCA